MIHRLFTAIKFAVATNATADSCSTCDNSYYEEHI